MSLYEPKQPVCPSDNGIVGEVCPRTDDVLSEAVGRMACVNCLVPAYLHQESQLADLVLTNNILIAINEGLYDDKKDVEAALEEAMIDSITRLPNRQAFDELCEDLTKRGDPYAIAVADIDGMKRLNDEHGHPEGDRLLQVVAKSLKKQSRPGDVPCRIGGDEFGIILEGVESLTPEQILTRCLLMEEAVETAIDDSGFPKNLQLGITVGVASTDLKTRISTYREADEVLIGRKTLKKRRQAANKLFDDRLL